MSEPVFEKQRELEELERKAQWVNVGEPAITGLKNAGIPERKTTCEDVKINDPEKGLFMVADGVSTGHGWFAARKTAECANAFLGKELDVELERIVSVERHSAEQKQRLMDAQVKAQMQRAVRDADHQVSTRAEIQPELKDSSSTISLAKIVEMPDGNQYLYVTNVGDSRVYGERDGKLSLLTQDDNELKPFVEKGTITPEDAHKIDQADGSDELPDMHAIFFRYRNVIRRAVGKMGGASPEVKCFKLKPGDRVVITSDGVHNNMKQTKIAQTLRGQKQDRAAERALQQAADKIAEDGTEGRSKADDIAAVVFTVKEHGPDRSYVHEQQNVAEVVITKEQREGWRSLIPELERSVQEVRAAVEAAPKDSYEQAKQRVQLNRAEDELTRTEYWVAHEDLAEVKNRIPPRFSKDAKIRFYRSDLEPPAYDRVPWTVSHYDETTDQYVVTPISGKPKLVERFTLELWQNRALARPQDQINLGTDGVFTLVGETKEGQVIMEQTTDAGVERRGMTRQEVDLALRENLKSGRFAKKTVARTKAHTQKLQAELKSLIEQKDAREMEELKKLAT